MGAELALLQIYTIRADSLTRSVPFRSDRFLLLLIAKADPCATTAAASAETCCRCFCWSTIRTADCTGSPDC